MRRSCVIAGLCFVLVTSCERTPDGSAQRTALNPSQTLRSSQDDPPRVVHLVQEKEAFVGLQGPLTELHFTEFLKASPLAGRHLHGGVVQTAVHCPCDVDSIEVLWHDEVLAPRADRVELARDPGYLILPAVRRLDPKKMRRRNAQYHIRNRHEPVSIGLFANGSVEVTGDFVQTRLLVRVEARAEISPVKLQVSFADQVLGEFDIHSSEWRVYEQELKVPRQLGGLRFEVPAAEVSDVEWMRLRWIELESPGLDQVLVHEKRAGKLYLRYRPILPQVSESILSPPGSPGKSSLLLLGGGAELRLASGTLSTLRVNGELWDPQLWQSGVLSLQDCEPGLYHLEYSGDDPRLRLRQPLAGLVPLLVDGPFRLQDDPAGYNFEGGTSLDVEWNRVRARLECAHDRRAAFLLPPPSHLQLAVDTRAGDRLRYAFGAHDPNLLDASGMTRPPDQWPRRPVTFKVLWQIDPAAEPVVLDEVVWPHEKPSWLEREVVFSPEIAGDGVLTFTTDSEAHASGIVAAAVADPRIVRANPEGSPQVNLLLYCIDTLRADHLSCYGRENLTSPHLDQLAADGYLFENFYAVASWTRPSIASALTGLYPSYHGAAGEDRALSLESRTLAENLERVHYSNWAMVSNHQVAARGLSFEQGFHRFVAPEGLWATDEDLNLPSSLRLSETIFPWWDRYADEPFFLYSHSLDPHGPYHPPDGYFDRFTEGYDGPLRSIKLLAPRKELRRRSEHIQPEDVRYVRNVYDGAVTYQDEQIGRLLEQLDRHGLRDDTILVIFSDHGEEFFEHGDWDHAGRMWEELLRVPLILWIPERLRADLKSPPLRVSAPVSQVDLVPSLLELLGIPDESPRQGRSFLPILREAEVDERPIYCEENIRGSLIHGGYKLIWLRSRTTTEYQLFDLKADPGEQDDLRERRPDLLQEMVIRRNQFEEEMEAVGVDAATGAATVDLDAEARRQLKALGYFDH